MLGWLLLGALLGAAVITICVPYLNKSIAKDMMRENGIKRAKIRKIVTSDGVPHIKLDGLKDDGTEQQMDIEAEDYDPTEIRENITLIA